MSNRIDFFQSERTQVSLPAGKTSIFFDGSLCPYLELKEIVRSGWPEFSWARLAYHLAAWSDAEMATTEDIMTELGMGKSISIHRFYNGLHPGAGPFSFPIYYGQIEAAETKLDSDGKSVEITARDFSVIMERVTVYGQRVSNTDSSTVFLSGADTIFNENGEADATAEPIENNGNSYRVFCAEPSTGAYWSYAQVIYYLLCEYLPGGCLQVPTIEELEALTDGQIARDLDLTGSNLLDALHRCCDEIGLEFRFLPRLEPTGPRQAIAFFKFGSGREVELGCQRTGEQLNISKTNIAHMHSRKNFWPVTHRYVGQGDFEVCEATFDLVKAWDPADEDTNYEKFSPSTNPNFYQVKDVYRKWCLNEADDYSSSPYSQGEAFDFSKIFQGADFVCRRRHFLPALSTDKQGNSLGYFLQVSFDNGQSWWQYLRAFNNFLDECGVWLSSDQLGPNTWNAALNDVLKFRITASVVGDERLSCVVADGPVDSTIPVVDHVFTLPRQFRYRKVSGQSIFAGVTGKLLGVPDEVDDTVALYEFVRKKALAGCETIETVDVRTPFLILGYEVGDIVSTSPESRDLLSFRSDNRSMARIERVQMDFEDQCTNLKIVRRRKCQL